MADLGGDSERAAAAAAAAGGAGGLDDELTRDCIVDVDLSALVLRPVGVEHNEWLATHSQSTLHRLH